jgi:hypothetical protein
MISKKNKENIKTLQDDAVYYTVPIIFTSCYISLLNALPIWLAAMVTRTCLADS